MGIYVLEDKCTGCSVCVKKCPFGAIRMMNKKASILDTCNMCRACLDVCRFDAICEAEDEANDEIKVNSGVDLSDSKDIWVFAEQKEGKILDVAFELLGEGRRLADKCGQKLCAVLLGHNISDQAAELIYFGADKVFVYDNEELGVYQDDLYTTIMTELILENRPSVVLFGATSTGRSLAPRLAVRIKTGLTADCTGLDIDDETGNLLQTRPAFGGNIMATIECPNHRPQMATVRPKVMKAIQKDTGRTGEIVKRGFDTAGVDLKTVVLEVVKDIQETVNLADANIIIAGGRGMGDAKNFKLLEDLAKVLGGAVGASRAVVDSGWISYPYQIGQTGKTVCPKIYFACGISGAVQHLAGMSSSDIIIAINKNKDAPIFDVATYGIVGDCLEVIPALIREFEKIRSSNVFV
jgi:electron transfer flavoprotein alpha subunit